MSGSEGGGRRRLRRIRGFALLAGGPGGTRGPARRKLLLESGTDDYHLADFEDLGSGDGRGDASRWCVVMNVTYDQRRTKGSMARGAMLWAACIPFVSSGCAQGDLQLATWEPKGALQTGPGSTMTTGMEESSWSSTTQTWSPSSSSSQTDATSSQSSAKELTTSEASQTTASTSSDNGTQSGTSEEEPLPGGSSVLHRGEVVIETGLDPTKRDLNVQLKVFDGLVDVSPVKMKSFDTDKLVIRVPTKMTRTHTGASYDLLCIKPGESMFYLPFDASTAEHLKSVSLSWTNPIPKGNIDGGRIYVRVLDVQGPSDENSDFVIWYPDAPVKFAYSSCRGSWSSGPKLIGGYRTLFNVGFAGEPGLWKVQLEAIVPLKRFHKPRRQKFSLFFQVGE